MEFKSNGFIVFESEHRSVGCIRKEESDESFIFEPDDWFPELSAEQLRSIADKLDELNGGS